VLVRFFTDLRAGGVPATLPEFLVLLEGLEARLAALSPEGFYYLARTALVKDERHFDRFDRVFARHFAGAEDFFQKLIAQLLFQMPPRRFFDCAPLRRNCFFFGPSFPAGSDIDV